MTSITAKLPSLVPERMHVIGLDASSVAADWIASVVNVKVRIEAGDGEFIIHRELS